MDAGSLALESGPLRAVLDPLGPTLYVSIGAEPLLETLFPAPPAAFQTLLGHGPSAITAGEVRGRAGPARRLEWLVWRRGGLGLRWCVDVCEPGSGLAVQMTLENRGEESFALDRLCPLRGSGAALDGSEQLLWRDAGGPGCESLALARGPSGTTLLAGFVTGRHGFGVGRLEPAGLACESWLGSRVLRPGETLESDRAWIGVADSPSQALDAWARRAGQEMQARVPGRPSLHETLRRGLAPEAVSEAHAGAGVEPAAWRAELSRLREEAPEALLSTRGPLLASAGLADALRLEPREAFELGFASQRLALLDLDLDFPRDPGLAPILAGLVGGLVREPLGGAAAGRELLRRALPPLGREARRAGPETLLVQLRGERVAVLWHNPARQPRAKGASLRSLGVAGPVHGYDFFADEDLGLLETGVEPRAILAGGVRLVALTPPADRPQVVGSNLHVGMGTAEVAALRADDPGLLLVLRHPGRHDGSVWIARPGQARAQRVPVRFEDAADVVVR